MTQFEVGQRVKLLGKSIGVSLKGWDGYKKYMKGQPAHVTQIRSDGTIRVAVTYGMLGGYFKPRDLAPWNSLEESEEL